MRRLEENDLSGYVPPGVLIKLAPHLARLPELATDPYDIAHSHRYHGARAALFTRYVAQQLGMVHRDALVAERIAQVHDTGYALAEAGLVGYDEHAYASFAVALMLTGDQEIARGALLHNSDILPADATPAERVVRDIDRGLMLGAEGAVRWAISHGFVPLGMTREEWLASEQLDTLFDDRMPWTITVYSKIIHQKAKDLRVAGSTLPDGLPVFTVIEGHDFEINMGDLFWKHIVHFLFLNGLLEKYLDFEKQTNRWFWGEGATAENPNGPPWLVEPMMRDIQDLLHLKIQFGLQEELERLGLLGVLTRGLMPPQGKSWVEQKKEAEAKGLLPTARVVKGMSGQPVYREIVEEQPTDETFGGDWG